MVLFCVESKSDAAFSTVSNQCRFFHFSHLLHQLAVKGMDEKFVFQGVGMIFSGGFDANKWTVPEEERESRFVFIGKHLNHEFLREGFMACRVTESLRFAVGDEVEANVGDFQRGTIIKQWDEGNAYRIELKNSDKVNVWAPIDIDAYVRSVGSGSGGKA